MANLTDTKIYGDLLVTGNNSKFNGVVGIGGIDSDKKLYVKGTENNVLWVESDNTEGASFVINSISSNTAWEFATTGSGNGYGEGHFLFWNQKYEYGSFILNNNGNVRLGHDPSWTTYAQAASMISVYGNAAIGSSYVNTAAPSNGLIIEGNVGIGVTIPSEKLDVNGNGRFRSIGTTAGTSVLGVTSTGVLTTNVSSLIPQGTVTSITIGNGLSGSTNPITTTGTIGHANTSSVSNLSSNNSGNTFIQDLTLSFDTYGHVTGATAATGTVSIGNGTLTLGTSGIATGSATFTANQSTNSTFTVTVPGTNLGQSRTSTTYTITSSTGNNTILSGATTSLSGLMIATDKSKLDGIESGATYNPPNNSVTYDRIAPDLKSNTVISTSNIDWSTAAIFGKALTANTTFTFSNLQQNKVITLLLAGNYTITFPSYVRVISGEYDGAAEVNYVQLHCTISQSGSEQVWCVISQAA